MQSTKRRYCRRWGMVLAACCAVMPGWLMAQDGGIELPPPIDESAAEDPNDPSTTAPPSPGNYQEDYARLVNGGQTVNAYDMGLFGDSISLSTGALEFATTDVSLAGNSKIPVAFGRRRAVEDRGGGHTGSDGEGTQELSQQLDLGDWDMDVPYLEGVFVRGQGWKANLASGASVQRCSGPASALEVGPPPRTQNGSTFSARQFWQGIHLHVPGGGAREVLYLPNPPPPRVQVPTDGRSYRYVTSDFWFLGCTSTLQSGEAGEGFVARSPDGLTYTFDWMSRIWAGPVLWPRTDTTAQILREQVRLYVTRIEDRFGNQVVYEWDSANHRRLKAIRSVSAAGTPADERRLDFTYGATDGRIAQVKDNGSPQRTWSYAYDAASGHLSSVTQPDGSRWSYDFKAFGNGQVQYEAIVPGGPVGQGYDTRVDCNWMRNFIDTTQVRRITITHPSGAKGEFDVDVRRHGRANVPGTCRDADVAGQLHFPLTPARFDVWALTRKAISGPSLPAAGHVWTYEYGSSVNKTGGLGDLPLGSVQGQHCGSANPCETSKLTQVTAPDGTVTRSTFDIDVQSGKENKLTDVAVLNGGVLRSETIAYQLAPAPFPAQLGETPQVESQDSGTNTTVVPEKSRAITQGGVTFTRSVSAFDAFAYPTTVTRSSTGADGASVTEDSTYAHHKTKWMLGQLATLKVGAAVQVGNTYDPTTAMLQETRRFGKLQWSLEYWPDGTLKSATDGKLHKTTYGDYKRGIARSVGYADGTTQTAEVDNLGAITSITDEVNRTTGYEYWPDGRLKKIVYPADTPAWNSRNFQLEQLTGSDTNTGGVAGQWKQTVALGQYRKMTLFDALWRPVLVREEEIGQPGTLRFTATRYDHEGRATFVSYPQSTRAALGPGTTTGYDGLGRVRSIVQNNGGSSLTTSIDYDTGFTKKVTSARGNSTVTRFKAYDEPSEEWPVRIDAYDVPPAPSVPAALMTTTRIVRDAYGKPKSIQRSGPTGTPNSTRTFVYDANELPCKTVDPESGATLQGYDAAGNLDWTIRGSTKTGSACDSADAAAVKASYTYDARNRLTGVTYSDNTPWLQQTWYGDGALHTTQIAGGAKWTYGYNSRGLLDSEALDDDGQPTALIVHLYDANGAESMLSYPDGSSVAYQPNALGQPTRVAPSSGAAYASGVTYWPNGALKGFTYGNQVVHTLSQDDRQLPRRSLDKLGTTAVVDLEYAYDVNTNVASVTDGAQSGAGNENRTMTYDGLDRLATASAPNLWGNATFTYDALDNLVHSQVGTRNYTHTINATTNRLDTISGSGTTIGYGYDARGNAIVRGGQGFVYDAADRLVQATGKESYAYDGLGRRVRMTQAANGTKRYQGYAKDGRLLFGKDSGTGASTNYLYLNESLVARAESTPVPVPSPPTVTAPATNTSGSFAISWTAPAYATAYTVRESRDGGSTWRQVYTGSGTTTTLTQHGNGIYQFQAQACNASGCSLYGASATTTVSGVTTPTMPAGLVANPNPSRTGVYELRWSTSAGATQYRLEENANDTGWGVADLYAGSAPLFAVAGRTDGTYRYRVSACNANACSAPRGPLDVVVAIASVPGPPVLTLASSSASATYSMSWTAVGGATTYELQELAPGAWAWSSVYTGTARTWTATGRTNGTYAYHVRSCNAAGCGDYGPASTIAVTTVGAPPPPATFTVKAPDGSDTSTTGAATASWTAPPSGTVTRYKLDWKPPGATGWSTRYEGLLLSKSETGLSNGDYDYRLAACSGATEASCSRPYREATLKVRKPLPPPGEVSGFHVTPTTSTDGAYTLSWDATAGADRYLIDEKINNGAWDQGAYVVMDATQRSFTGQNNGSYAYRIRACSEASAPLCGGYGTAEASVTVSRPNGIAPPTEIHGEPGCRTTPPHPTRTFIVGWSPVANATRYVLEEGDDLNRPHGPIDSATNTIQLTRDHATVDQVTYSYRVKACNGPTDASCSAWRGTATVCVGREDPLRPGAQIQATTSVVYQHTDGLRSVVAETNASGVVTGRTRYEPYGAPTSGEYVQGPGYAGHVMDAATQLVYMQQRYYDPIAGRFLSTDPVEASPANFNRYWYANNNPYKYIDPDGRCVDGPSCEGMAQYFGAHTDEAAPLVPYAMGVVAVAGTFSGPIAAGLEEIGTYGFFNSVLTSPSTVAEVGLAVTETTAAIATGTAAPSPTVAGSIKVGNSPAETRAALEEAGYMGKAITNKAGTESGTLHNIPKLKMDVRVMDGSPNHPPRVVTNRQGTTSLVKPENGSNYANGVSIKERRIGSHIHYER